MNTNPWKLWKDDGTANPGTREIVATLRRVLDKDPKHPGANHYYIHALEASKHPELAVKSAEALEGMMPAAGHLEHMPAHIMQRVGRYEEAAEANRKGAAADLAYLKETSAPDYYPMYLIHNFQFLASAAGMEGRRAEAIAALKDARAHIPDQLLFAMPGLDWSASFHLRRLHKVRHVGRHAEGSGARIQSCRAPRSATFNRERPRSPRRAKSTRPRRNWQRHEKLIAAVPEDATQGNNSARSLYAIGQLKAKARIASVRAKHDEAIQLLTRGGRARGQARL